MSTTRVLLHHIKSQINATIAPLIKELMFAWPGVIGGRSLPIIAIVAIVLIRNNAVRAIFISHSYR